MKIHLVLLVAIGLTGLAGCAHKRVPVGTAVFYTESGAGSYTELGPVNGSTFGYCLHRQGIHNAGVLRALKRAKRMGGNGVLFPDSFSAGNQFSSVGRCRWLFQLILIPGSWGSIRGIAIQRENQSYLEQYQQELYASSASDPPEFVYP